MPVKLSNIFSKIQWALVASVFVIIDLIGYIFFFTTNHFDKPAPFTFEIKVGESYNSVTEKLHEQSIIPSKFNFKVSGFIFFHMQNLVRI